MPIGCRLDGAESGIIVDFALGSVSLERAAAMLMSSLDGTAVSLLLLSPSCDSVRLTSSGEAVASPVWYIWNERDVPLVQQNLGHYLRICTTPKNWKQTHRSLTSWYGLSARCACGTVSRCSAVHPHMFHPTKFDSNKSALKRGTTALCSGAITFECADCLNLGNAPQPRAGAERR